MRVVLCEKPSQGKDIARVLGARQREAGCLAGPGIKVTWGIGHLIEAAPPEAYGEHFQRWSLETLPIVPQQWRWVVKADTASQFKVVQRLLAQASELIIATDADREGEMIARELIEYCGYRGPIQRLWLSALNDASIRKALGALRVSHETLPLYHCALARSPCGLARRHQSHAPVHAAGAQGRFRRGAFGGPRADAHPQAGR